MKKELKDKKLQFRFSDEAIKRLDCLKEKSSSSTRAEVIRNALQCYEYLLEQSNKGYTIQIVKGEDVMTIVPMLV